MPTDWPGHGATNRHLHYLTPCDCSTYFADGQEPPWLYLFPALPAQGDIIKAFLETGRYLTARTNHPLCRWEWNNALDVTDPAFKTVFVWPEPIQLGVEWQNVVHVAHSTLTFFWEYKRRPDQQYVIGDPIDRGTVWTYEDNDWEKIIDTAVPEKGPPIGVPILTPMDCLPGWIWGEPIPDA